MTPALEGFFLGEHPEGSRATTAHKMILDWCVLGLCPACPSGLCGHSLGPSGAIWASNCPQLTLSPRPCLDWLCEVRLCSTVNYYILHITVLVKEHPRRLYFTYICWLHLREEEEHISSFYVYQKLHHQSGTTVWHKLTHDIFLGRDEITQEVHCVWIATVWAHRCIKIKSCKPGSRSN